MIPKRTPQCLVKVGEQVKNYCSKAESSVRSENCGVARILKLYFYPIYFRVDILSALRFTQCNVPY